MTAAEIIDAFGGTRALADRLGLPRGAVANWRRLGIPARYWFSVLDHAEALHLRGVTRDAVQWRPRAAVKVEAAA